MKQTNLNNFESNENDNVTMRPKPMISKIDRSKTAPSEQFFPITENEGSDDRYSTYNYYIYYHSIKPRDPRLPLPTYKPEPDLAFLRDKAINDDKNNEDDKIYEPPINIDNSYENNDDINSMMTNLHVRDNNVFPGIGGSGNSQKSGYFENIGQTQLFNEDSTFGFNNNNTSMGFNNNLNSSTSIKSGGSNYSNSGFGVGGFQQQQTPPNNFDYYRNANSITGGGNSSLNQREFNDFNDNSYGNQFSGVKGGMGGKNQQQMYQQQPQIQQEMYYQQQQQQFNQRDNFYGGGMQGKIGGHYNKGINQGMGQNPYYMMNQQQSQYGGYNTPYIQGGGMNREYRNINNMGNNNNRMGMNNNIGSNMGYNPNVYSQMQGYGGNQYEGNSYMNVGAPYQGMSNPYMMGGGGGHQYNNSPYNMNLMNKGYQGNDFKRISLDKDKQQNYDLNISDINGKLKKDNIDMLSRIIDLCKDHNGSRLVQKFYGEASDEDKNKIFEKLFPHIQNLSVDVFGNYVIQKLFEFSDSIRRKQIIKLLEGQIFDLTLHMYGCRVIQKAIEVIEVDEIRAVLKEIKKDIRRCIEDQNGNHVVQKLIEKLPKGEHNEILKVIYGNCYDLSVHQYGCRVIQRIFEFCREEDKEKILEEILNRAFELIQDQFGNYVIQHIVEKQGSSKCLKIYQFLQGKIYDFSVHKFASNVVEKCLTLGNSKQRKEIVDEILNREDNDSLLAMVRDKYGNYVVQKMIEYSDQKTKELIIKKISTSQALKKRDGFSKHVINFIEKMGFPTPGTLAFQQQFGGK